MYVSQPQQPLYVVLWELGSRLTLRVQCAHWLVQSVLNCAGYPSTHAPPWLLQLQLVLFDVDYLGVATEWFERWVSLELSSHSTTYSGCCGWDTYI